MYYNVGKIFNLVEPAASKQYSEVQFDVLWYLLDLTKVNRCISQESFQEFLTRYLLITETDLEQSALDFIDHGVLIDGYLKDEFFSFSVKDFIALMGFSTTTSAFNIQNTLDGFIKKYKYYSPNVYISQGRNASEISLTTDALKYGLMGLSSLLQIDSISINFKDDLKQITKDELTKTINFSKFVANSIDKSHFINFTKNFPMATHCKERFYPDKVLSMNVFNDIKRENLIEIYKIILDAGTLAIFLEIGTSDDDLNSDLGIPNEHIKFAWGVKHGYIQLSSDIYSFRYCFDTYFDLDIDHIYHEDIFFPTQDIYDSWEMSKWEHWV